MVQYLNMLVSCDIFGFAEKIPVSDSNALSLNWLSRSLRGAHERSMCAHDEESPPSQE